MSSVERNKQKRELKKIRKKNLTEKKTNFMKNEKAYQAAIKALENETPQ